MSFFRKLKDQIRMLLGKKPKEYVPSTPQPIEHVVVVPQPVPPQPVFTPTVIPMPTYPPQAPTPVGQLGSGGSPTAPANSTTNRVGIIYRWGTKIDADVDIAADWIPDFGLTLQYGAYLGASGPAAPESFIANPPGARSPRGYPMWDGKVKFDNREFDSDLQVSEYIHKEAARTAALQLWQMAFSRVFHVGKSGIHVQSTTPEERAYLQAKSVEFLGDLFRYVVSGTNDEINNAINEGSHNRVDWNGKGRHEIVYWVDQAFQKKARGERLDYEHRLM